MSTISKLFWGGATAFVALLLPFLISGSCLAQTWVQYVPPVGGAPAQTFTTFNPEALIYALSGTVTVIGAKAGAIYGPAAGPAVPSSPYNGGGMEVYLYGAPYVYSVDEEATDTITGYMKYQGNLATMPATQIFLVTTYLGASGGFMTIDPHTSSRSLVSAYTNDDTYGGSASQEAVEGVTPDTPGSFTRGYLLTLSPDPSTGIVPFTVKSESGLIAICNGDRSDPIVVAGEYFTVTTDTRQAILNTPRYIS
jgi:hypothetical protein